MNSDEWKIEKRKRSCAACTRPFASEEPHYSGIVESEGRFARRDVCLACWPSQSGFLFSFWLTLAPRHEQRTLDDINAMTDFFKKLVEQPPADPLREKVVYLTALLLMRKKRLRALGSRPHEGRSRLTVEKSWDGDVIEIVEPTIADDELERLKSELEQLFAGENAAETVA